MKKLFGFVVLLWSVTSFAANRVYTFECPTPAMVVENQAAHVGVAVIDFRRNSGVKDYPWVPPFLELDTRLVVNATPTTFYTYSAVLFGQELQCVYNTSLGKITLHLKPSNYYRNPKADIPGFPHAIQLEQ